MSHRDRQRVRNWISACSLTAVSSKSSSVVVRDQTKLVKSVSWQSNLTQKCTFGVAYTGRVAAVMAYQPPNDVGDPQAMDLASYTNVHLFAEQSQAVSNVTIHQMGCGWNQTGKLLA